MTTYYLWCENGTMYAIDADDPKAADADRLRKRPSSTFRYGAIKMVRCLGVA